VGKGIARRLPLSPGGPEFVIAIDDESFDGLAAQMRTLGTFASNHPLMVVRASDLADPHTDADLYVGRLPSGDSGLCEGARVCVRRPSRPI
jgi:hypothetical protein